MGMDNICKKKAIKWQRLYRTSQTTHRNSSRAPRIFSPHWQTSSETRSHLDSAKTKRDNGWTQCSGEQSFLNPLSIFHLLYVSTVLWNAIFTAFACMPLKGFRSAYKMLQDMENETKPEELYSNDLFLSAEEKRPWFLLFVSHSQMDSCVSDCCLAAEPYHTLIWCTSDAPSKHHDFVHRRAFFLATLS